jgi:hypothetical protein
MHAATSLNYLHTQAKVALDTSQSTENREFAAAELINALPHETVAHAALAIAEKNDRA